MHTELSWGRDTRDEFMGNLIEVHPDPLDLVSVHLYPHDHANRFGQEYTSYEEMARLSQDACRKARKPLLSMAAA